MIIDTDRSTHTTGGTKFLSSTVRLYIAGCTFQPSNYFCFKVDRKSLPARFRMYLESYLCMGLDTQCIYLLRNISLWVIVIVHINFGRIVYIYFSSFLFVFGE